MVKKVMRLKNKGWFFFPENVFLFLGIFCGLIFLLVTPPFQVPDEPCHFLRAFQISEGDLIAQKNPKAVGGFLPESLISTIKVFDDFPLHREKPQRVENILQQLNSPLEKNKRVFADFPNTAIYSPVPYLPQAIGIAIGRAFDFPPIMLMYMGRVLNLSLWIALIYIAIRISPVYKWLLLLLALSPMSLFQAASLSADGMTNSVSFLLISLFMKKAFDCNVGGENIAWVYILSLMLALSKQAYFLMPMLFLLIPKEKIPENRYLKIFVSLLLASAVTVLLWSFSVQELYRSIYTVYGAFLNNVSPERQIRFISSNPLQYCRIVFETFSRNGMQYLSQFIGHLGWLDTSLPIALKVGYGISLVGIALTDTRERIIVDSNQKLLLLLVLTVSVMVIVTLLYITGSAVAAPTIGGIQGRYFIPLSPLFFLLLYPNNKCLPVHKAAVGLIASCSSCAALACTAYVLFHRYYQ